MCPGRPASAEATADRQTGPASAVDACTDLYNPVWTPLQTNTLTTNTLYFSDPEWTNYPNRFYRLRWQ